MLTNNAKEVQATKMFNFQSNFNNAMSGKLNAVFWSADQNLN